MASFFSSMRQGITGGRNKNNNSNQNKGSGQSSPASSVYQPSPTSTQPPSVPQIPHSPALSAQMSLESQQQQAEQVASSTRKPPFFFRDEYASLIVRGNFMTLAAQPALVETGEWLAHQLVEQYRLLEQMIDIIKVIDERTGVPVCNPNKYENINKYQYLYIFPTNPPQKELEHGVRAWLTVPTSHTYTWLDNNKKPIKIPAIQYINLVQKWIVGKINDSSIFPTDTTSPQFAAATYASGSLTPMNTSQPLTPTTLNASLSTLAGRDWMGKSSGFPESFESDIKSIYRQMMRCYAHLYHGHWLDPFWNVNAYKELNTCFIHFVNVGKLFELIGDKEMEPMQPLIDLWLAKGLLPPPQTAAAKAENVAPAQSAPGTAA